jgi:hypothetical protein
MDLFIILAQKMFLPVLSRGKKIVKPSKKILNDKGQGFIEFLLLIFVVLSLSVILTRGINRGMGDRWTRLVRLIAGHELNIPPTVELP